MDNMYYILDKDKQVVPVDAKTWSDWFEKIENRRVEKTVLPNGYEVSTVFLGLDMSWGGTTHQLFETIVFTSNIDRMEEKDMDRYSTWDQAVKGHERMVAKWGKK